MIRRRDAADTRPDPRESATATGDSDSGRRCEGARVLNDEQAVFGWRFTGPLMMGSILNPVNSSMIATALVGIGVDFHRGPSQTAILVSVLYLCSAVMQPTMGKLAQVFGNRRVFLCGLMILLIAGIVGTLAPAFWCLVVSRALIGVGTSAAYPTAMALVRARAAEFGTGVPSRVLGGFSIASQVIAVIGLPLGGVLTGAFGWRAVFFINIPITVIAATWALMSVPRDPTVDVPTPGELVRVVDLLGVALFGGTVIGLLVLLGDLHSPRWWLIAVVAVLAVALVTWERHAGQPLIDVRMLASNGPLMRTYVRQALASLGSYTAMYGISQWMEQSAGYSATQVGLILIPLSAVSIVAARYNSVTERIRTPLVITGAAFIASGIATMVIVDSSSVTVLITMTVLFGLANGMSGYANQATLYLQSPASEIGVASGLYRTFAYLGAIVSSSLIGIAFGSHATDHGLHIVGITIVAIGAVLVVMTIADRRIPRTALADTAAV